MSTWTSPLWGRTGVKSPLWGLGGSSSPLWGRLGVNSMFSPWGDRGVISSLRAHSHYEYTFFYERCASEISISKKQPLQSSLLYTETPKQSRRSRQPRSIR